MLCRAGHAVQRSAGYAAQRSGVVLSAVVQPAARCPPWKLPIGVKGSCFSWGCISIGPAPALVAGVLAAVPPAPPPAAAAAAAACFASCCADLRLGRGGGTAIASPAPGDAPKRISQ